MSYYDWVALGTILGFLTLAAVLLVPVYFFLKKEEEVSERYFSNRTPPPSGDGAVRDTEAG